MNIEIPLFFSVDDNYAPYLATALYSAWKNSKATSKYKAIVLYKDLSEENITKISKLSKENFEIEFVAMESGMESIKDEMQNRLRCDYFTLTIYYRLFIPRMFPQYDKGIYIDSDVVITTDLKELFDIDLGDNLIAACTETSVGDIPELVDYMNKSVGVEKEEYLNSGMLLMNLKALREKELDKHFLKLLTTYKFDSVAPDQDYINAICKNKILYLGPEWNSTPNDNHPPVDNPKIIHYNLFSKPWCYDNVMYGDEFWKYAEHSGYIEEIRAFKRAYSEEKKKSDAACMQLLVDRAKKISKNEVTFRSVHENGGKVRL